MKTGKKIIIAVSVAIVSLFVIITIIPSNAWWITYPCQLEFGIPEADALIVHQSIGQTYNQADVIVVGTITESYPCIEDNIVTRMTVNVEEYLKNPLDEDIIRLQSRGGEIAGVGGIWVEDEKIFETGDKVLLFLSDPKDNVYKISPYSTLIDTDKISGIDLIKGIELRADNYRITLSNGESRYITLLLDSFFGYDKTTPVSVAAFTFYDLVTGEDASYEDPADLGKFGIHIKPVMITPNVDSTVTFDLPIIIDEDAKEGKYFVELLAQTQEQSESIKYASWKLAHKQIQIIVETQCDLGFKDIDGVCKELGKIREKDIAVNDANNIVDANNQFALDFYYILSKNNEKNLFFSPTSIATAFAIVYEGARGDTAQEMQNVFGFSKDDDKRRSEFESLYKNLNEENEWYKLNMANALWIAQGFEPISDYVDTAKTYYNSNVQNVDFITNDGVNTINEWVKDKTEDKIQEILAQDSTDEFTRMVITNAMYFKGKWSSPFDSRNTSDESFWIDASMSVKVPMMKDVGNFNYAETNEFKALEMYYLGDRLSMLVLLPNDRNGLDALGKSLDLQKLSDLKDKMNRVPLTVHIPKFEFDTEYNLIEKLQSLGVHQAFDENNANFDGITKAEKLFIEQAIHKAFVDVNEEGTEAAAVTALVIIPTSGPPEPKHEFIVDHPFIFIIQEKYTGEILFMGKVMDPTK